MKKIGIIPARYNSKRLPGKPLAEIHGRPMIYYVYQNAIKSNVFDEIAVATDDRRIIDAVEDFGGRAVMTSCEHQSGTDRLAQASRIMGVKKDDIVVNIQGDEPLMNPDHLKLLTDQFDQSNIEMATLASPLEDVGIANDPSCAKVVMDNDGFALYFSRSPIPFYRDCDFKGCLLHIGVYAYTALFLEIFTKFPTGRLESYEKLEQLRAIENGRKIKVIIVDKAEPGVDTIEDLERVRHILKRV